MSKMLVAAAVTAASVAGLAGINAVSAQSNSGSFADRISERFNLNSEEVQTFLDEQKDERRADKQEARQAHLEGLVDEGVITEAQLEALQERVEEMREAKQELKDSDLTREEMREAIDDAKEEFEEWAEEQGIDLDEIRPERGEGRHGKGKLYRNGLPSEQQPTEAEVEVQSS